MTNNNMRISELTAAKLELKSARWAAGMLDLPAMRDRVARAEAEVARLEAEGKR